MLKALLALIFRPETGPNFDPIDAAISEGVQAGLDARGTVTHDRHATPLAPQFYRQETGDETGGIADS